MLKYRSASWPAFEKKRAKNSGENTRWPRGWKAT